MTSERLFPVLMNYHERQRLPHCPRSVPWDLVAAHETQALHNHGGQTLERLAERGGLGPEELFYILQDQPWPHGTFVKLDEAVSFLLQKTSEKKA